MLFVDSDMDDDEDELSSVVDENVDEEIIENGGELRKKKKRKRPKNKKDVKISNEEAKDLRDKEHTYSSNLYRVQVWKTLELLNEFMIINCSFFLFF